MDKYIDSAGLRTFASLLKAKMDSTHNSLQETDTALRNDITELQESVFPLTVDLSLSTTLVEYTGEAVNVTASYKVKRKDTSTVPTSLSYTLDDSTNTLTPAANGNIVFNIQNEGNKTISVTAVYGSLKASRSASVRMVAPIYYGFGADSSIAVADNKLSVRTSAAGTYSKTNATGSTSNLIILVPVSIGYLNNFSMGGAPFVMENSSVTINSVNYTMYKSGSTFPDGTTVTIQAN